MIENTKGFFKYVCDYWDNEAKSRIIAQGVILSDTFINAMDRIMKIYGEDSINKISFSVDENFYSDFYEFKNKRKDN